MQQTGIFAGVFVTGEIPRKTPFEDVGGRGIHCVIGGMHLLSVGLERLAITVDRMKRLGVARCIPGHCTGAPAEDLFAGEFGDGFRPLMSGTWVVCGTEA